MSETRTPPFERIGGQTAVDRIVEEFYRRMNVLPEARGIRAMHAENLGPTKVRLKRYLGEWLGGPKLYSAERGHPRLRMRHMHVRIGTAERDAWMLCMEGAVASVVPACALRDELLHSLRALADWMRNDPAEPPPERAS